MSSMNTVKDGRRSLQFEGKLLAESTSERTDSVRWIEFKLYKTENGSYVLSRVGVSLVFHSPTCQLTFKYKLKEARPDELSSKSIPCSECDPDESTLVFPETHRYWAQVSDKPEAVLDALYKYDQNSGAYYLTTVARKLMDKAAQVDKDVAAIYNYEIIP